jgi:uncharacterized protein YjbI with pentapeptide repeats
VGADLSSADLADASLDRADLRNTDLTSIHWQQIRSIRGANLFGIKNAPPGFLKWALQQGAVQTDSDSQR